MRYLNKETSAKLKVYSDEYKRLKESKEIIENSFEEARKTDKYIQRSKNDYLLASAAKKLIENTDLRLGIGLPEKYQNIYHWFIIISYYSMYHAATAAIAKKKIKCTSHIATITSLAKHYATDEELELEFIKTLKYVYINYIEGGRERRRHAQYDVDVEYSKQESYQVFDDAGKFVKRVQQILDDS